MYREYNKKVEFFLVYVSEAHGGAKQLGALGCDQKPPRTLKARAAVARKMVKDMKITIPVLIADMEKTVERAYTPCQARTCIIDKEGKFLYAGEPSHRGANPKKLAENLKKLP